MPLDKAQLYCLSKQHKNDTQIYGMRQLDRECLGTQFRNDAENTAHTIAKNVVKVVGQIWDSKTFACVYDDQKWGPKCYTSIW